MRKQRRQMAGAAAALLAAGLLTGCGGSQNADTVTSLKIGVSVYDQYDTFLAEMMTDMAAELKNLEQETNIQITMEVVNAGHSQLTQNDQVQDFLDSDYDILCVNLVDRTDASTIIDKAKNADTPVIFFNRELVGEDLQRWDKLYYVGADALESGLMEGQLVADACAEDHGSGGSERRREAAVCDPGGRGRAPGCAGADRVCPEGRDGKRYCGGPAGG